MPRRKMILAGFLLVALSLLVAACQNVPATPTPQPTPAEPTAVPPTPVPTVPPERTLVVCLGQEPTTLYMYGSSSRSTWSVLEAVYDGPFDTREYAAQPVILEKLPALADGDVQITPVVARAGDEVVDANGNLATLGQGTLVFPAGCSALSCAVTYDGASEISLDQMNVTFRLKPGITWSDGTPLTAADSVFSFITAASKDTPVSKRLIDRTADYKALDELTVQWTGKPGFRYSRFATAFWTPLPQHQLGSLSAADLLTNDGAAQQPLGWGPYTVQEWTRGDHITLRKNPNYFRAAEGLPKFDNLVFRFYDEGGDAALAALQNGECDIADQSTYVGEYLETVVDMQKAGTLKASIVESPDWEHMELAVRPVTYDDPTNLPLDRRPNFFGDVRVRQAFAYCMDRQTAVSRSLKGQAAVPDGFLTANHPLLAGGLNAYPYDPAQGSALLDAAGWKDDDQNPATPRVAYGVFQVPDGSRLEVNYLTTQAPVRVDLANHLIESMAACGIAVNLQALTPDELYAPGPDGPLFGRKFDMAQFSWQADNLSPCTLYETSQIPTSSNYWVGANVSGYSSAAFDEVCRAARSLLPGENGYEQQNADVQRLFSQELPAIPLYFQLNVAVTRPEICNFAVDASARSDLWNIEAIDSGEGCN
ncbi:MAG TPA: peptide ABC transporter substrate-binding protein [Anaerolineaceae bacterium]